MVHVVLVRFSVCKHVSYYVHFIDWASAASDSGLFSCDVGRVCLRTTVVCL